MFGVISPYNGVKSGGSAATYAPSTANTNNNADSLVHVHVPLPQSSSTGASSSSSSSSSGLSEETLKRIEQNRVNALKKKEELARLREREAAVARHLSDFGV